MRVNGRIIEDVKVDYASISYAKPKLLDGAVADKVLKRRIQAICKQEVTSLKPAAMYGYNGYRASDFGVFVGVRDDRLIEIVSGSTASGYDLCRDRPAVHVNRLDIQATLLLDECQRIDDAARAVEYEIDRIYEHIVQYRASARGAMARLTYSRVQSVSVDGIQGTTLYIGARSSDMMVRAYNKTVEARICDNDGYPALLRIEIEAKGAYAEQIRNDWIRMPEYRHIVYAELLRRYDIDLPISGSIKYRLAKQAMLSKDADRTMRWLIRSVAPTINRLLVQGIDREQLIALLFDQFDQHQSDEAEG